MAWPKVNRNKVETLAIEIALLPIKAIVGTLFFVAEWLLKDEESFLKCGTTCHHPECHKEEKDERPNAASVPEHQVDGQRYYHPQGNYRSSSAPGERRWQWKRHTGCLAKIMREHEAYANMGRLRLTTTRLVKTKEGGAFRTFPSSALRASSQ